MKNRMIIIEGPQGTGKTTLANYLRDNISSSNLYRLSGQKDKTDTGLEYSIIMYDALINYLKDMEVVPMDVIFDRTFMTEEVYARLGYKNYSFTEKYNSLMEELIKLKYDIYYFSLFLKDVNLFKERLDRAYHHNYQEFSVENSVNQQKMYLDIANELRKIYKVNVIELPMDDFISSYDVVNRLLLLRK